MRIVRVFITVFQRYFAIFYKIPFSFFDTCLRFKFLFFSKSKSTFLFEIDDRDRGRLLFSKRYAQFLDRIADDLYSSGRYDIVRLSRLGSLNINNSWQTPYSFEFLFLLSIFLSPLFIVPSFIIRLPFKSLFYSIYYLLVYLFLRPSIYFSTSPTKACCILFSFFNIPVVDVQHGIISSHHPFYFRRSVLQDARFVEYPSHLFLWRPLPSSIFQSSKNFIGSSLSYIGNPYWSYQSDTRFHTVDFNNELKFFKRLSNNSDLSLVYTTQPFKEFPLDTLFLSALQVVLSSKKVNLIVKAHPVVLNFRSEFDRLVKQLSSLNLSNLTVNISFHLGFLEIAGLVDYHITFSSTCVEDFAVFGIPSVATSSELSVGGTRSSAFLHEKSAGFLYLPPSEHELINFLLHSRHIKNSPALLPVVEYSTERLLYAVSDICKAS